MSFDIMYAECKMEGNYLCYQYFNAALVSIYMEISFLRFRKELFPCESSTKLLAGWFRWASRNKILLKDINYAMSMDGNCSLFAHDPITGLSTDSCLQHVIKCFRNIV
jgi:hypothetical protein